MKTSRAFLRDFRQHFPQVALLLLLPRLVMAQADPQAISDVAGVHKIVLTSGANFISVPFHHTSAFRGDLQSATADSVTLAGSPGWTVNQLGPQDGIVQYFLVVTKDASATPGVEGDWWHILANTSDTVTVDPHSDDLSTHLAAGDTLEIRRLTSIKDLFGFGSSCALNKDSSFDIITAEEDVIRTVVGTSFASEIFYHDGTLDTEGYYLNGTLIGTGDGSTITLNPGQPLMLFRKTGSPSVTNLVQGMVQTTRLTQYLGPGANAVGVNFPVEAPVSTSNLQESGWVSDVDFDILTTQEDIIRSVVGTSFGDEIFHYGGTDDVNGWYVNGTLNSSYTFQPTKGYIFFVKGPAPRAWRQAVPFDP